MSFSALLDRVDACLAPYGLATGLVAVSGGPDSVALARAALALQERGKVGRLLLAHFNHQLRGAESDADEAFVRTLVEQFPESSVSFHVERADTAGMARSRSENLENCARRLRYDWLRRIAQEHGAAWVVTAHTADDQAETVLHRLLRGTGLQGLAGIPAQRVLAPGIDLVRPLLRAWRAEVLAALHDLGQSYRQDSSNQNVNFTRNRIRLELLPQLAKHYNPAITDVLTRLADQAREVHDFVTGAAGQVLHQAELSRAGALVILDARRLSAVAPYLVREVFRLIWTRENWSAAEMNFDDWDRLAALAHQDTGAIDLPDGVRARRIGLVVQVGRDEGQK